MAGTSSSITLPSLAQKLRKMGPALARQMRKGLVEGAHIIVGQVQVEIESTTPHQPVDQGTMAGGYRAQRTDRGAKVVNHVPQALWIERGRRPGPISAEGVAHLAEWVRRKRLYTEELAQILASHKAGRIKLGTPGKRGSVRKDATERACRNVAEAIAKSIAKKGYAPRWPLKRAIKASHRRVLTAVVRSMREVHP